MTGNDADSMDVTPEGALEKALERLRAATRPPDKAIVLLLWDSTGHEYDIRHHVSGMHLSEIVALLEVMKARCLREMFEQGDNDRPHAEEK